jgi:hypothetical protein
MAEVFPSKDKERVIITELDGTIHGIMTHPDVYFDMVAEGLEEWCEANNVALVGMILDFPDHETALLFRMTWGI